MDKIVVSVIGAGGKMGTRTSNNLVKCPEKFEVLMSEASETGLASIRERGFEPIPAEEALKRADVVVFAVPDTLIRTLSEIYVPQLRPGAGFIILDPAAAVARELTLRDDCTFAVAHHVILRISLIRIHMRRDRTDSVAAEENRISLCPGYRERMSALRNVWR